MLYRAFIAGVALLWATMWVLLIRSEVQPGSGLRSVPLDHVLREVFKHERFANLRLSDGSRPVGTLRLAPRMDEGSRTLGVAGNAAVALPGGARQRTSWDGDIVFSADWSLKSLRLSTVTREVTPPPSGDPRQARPVVGSEPARLEFTLDNATRQAAYTMKVGDTTVDENAFTLDEEGLAGLLEHLGVDKAWVQQFSSTKRERPAVSAAQSTFLLRGQKLDTYLLSVTYQGQTWLRVQISQIGEILYAESLVGWKLETD